ncbi:MAG: hypothetical protein IPI02_18985 [Sterolibacteriaceae bacterium]|nr:hypothetical protein [Sterolibacteriaceae bacterium]
MSMYIESVPNRNSPPAVLLRESYRDDGKVRKRTLANLSCLSADVIEGLKVLLRGGVAVPSAESVFSVERSLPHGHVAAVLGAARGSGSSVWFASAPQDLRPVLQAMLVARVLEPASKLATHRMLQEDTATSSLGRVLGWATAAPMTCTGRWTGCTTLKGTLSGGWRASICGAAPWCCTTSPRPG